jgi:hypothetical protein
MSDRIAMIVAVVAALALAATPALAGKGSKAEAVPSPASRSQQSTAPRPANRRGRPRKLGDAVTFATTVEPLAGWEYPMVAVSCYQDVNGDGTVDTNLFGPDVVFTWLDKPSATFTLGGYSSIWTLRGGGDAVCRAELDAYGWKGGKESTRVLASTADWLAQG